MTHIKSFAGIGLVALVLAMGVLVPQYAAYAKSGGVDLGGLVFDDALAASSVATKKASAASSVATKASASGNRYYTPIYSTPSYSTPSYSTPSFSMPMPTYYPTGGGSSSNTASATGGYATSYSGGNTQTQNTGDVTQIVNIPAPEPQQLQPIKITNNNVNTNVNNNLGGGYAAPVASTPVYTQPTYYAPPVYATPTVTQAAQCSVYATASSHNGAPVTLSWATSGGNSVELYCTGGALTNRSVNAISTLTINPWSSTTCYVTVRNYNDSKTCSVYVPVQQQVYTPTVTYTQPTVQVASAVVPTYSSITLTQAPYTGFTDEILYPAFLVTLTLTALYVVYNRRRIFARA